VEAPKEAKKKLSPDEWHEVSRALINDVEKFVAPRVAELSEWKAAKCSGCHFINQTPLRWGFYIRFK
jgi:hypothetical protein